MPDANGLQEVRKLFATPELPELGPGPRMNVLRQNQINQAVGDCLSKSRLSPTARDLVRSLALLWHDHLEAAHVISQDIESADGSFVHGIVHRREPDYGNAKYWFRRVGKHPCFPEIATRVTALLESKQHQDFKTKLIARGEWDAFGFVDACEQASQQRRRSDPQNQLLLREVQRIEFEILLEYFCQT